MFLKISANNIVAKKTTINLLTTFHSKIINKNICILILLSRYPPRRMSPYPTPQMHAAQKRAAMYPMGSHAVQNPQTVPGGPMQYPHNQTNGVPVPMQQSYGRTGPMNAYGRSAGMMPQQRQNTPPYNNTGGHNQQFYGAGYQNVQG